MSDISKSAKISSSPRYENEGNIITRTLRSLRNTFFPIERHEWKKLLPLLAMMILTCFNYSLLKDMKILANQKEAGGEAANFQKFFYVMPASIIFMLFYTKIDVKYSKPTVFYIVLSIFTFSFMLAAAFNHHSETLQPKKGFAKAQASNHPFTEYFFTTIEFWTTAYFGIISELWGAVMLGLMFWGLANSLCTKDEAMRFYPIINIGATFSSISSGIVSMSKSGAATPECAVIAQIVMMGIVILFCFLIGAIYYYIANHVMTDSRLCPELNKPSGKKKVKMGFVDSIKFLVSSSYVFMISGVVAAYGMIVGFLETPYHSNAMSAFAKKKDSFVKGLETAMGGVVVLILLLVLGSRSVRIFGWTKTALFSPIVIAVFGTTAFIVQLCYFDTMKSVYAKMKVNRKDFVLTKEEDSVVLIVYIFSTLSMNLARSLKYSFFDPTKELAYLPLDPELRGKAKAAVDVVGARFGKSGPCLIQLIMILCGLSNGMECLPYVFGIYCVFMVLWFVCTVFLGRKYEEFEAERKAREAAEIQMTSSTEKSDIEKA